MGVRYGIVIVVAGPAGLSFACLASEHGLKIGLINQQGEELLAAPPPDGRDIALTHLSHGHHSFSGIRKSVIINYDTSKWRDKWEPA